MLVSGRVSVETNCTGDSLLCVQQMRSMQYSRMVACTVKDNTPALLELAWVFSVYFQRFYQFVLFLVALSVVTVEILGHASQNMLLPSQRIVRCGLKTLC